MLVVPPSKFALSGPVHIAYQVVGDGPIDLVFVHGFAQSVDLMWDFRLHAQFLGRLAGFSRLIHFDKRGTGQSDRDVGIATPDERMDDLRAVMDAAGAERAVLVGESEGGPMCVQFAATNPDRVSSLVLYGTYARLLSSDDYPLGVRPDTFDEFLVTLEAVWGTQDGVQLMAGLLHPDEAADPESSQRLMRYMRNTASPSGIANLLRMNALHDVREILAAVNVPTLVVHRTGDRFVRVEAGRYLAEHIPGARLAELPGTEHPAAEGDSDAVARVIEEWVTGRPARVSTDRVLATVLFVDIVSSTERATQMGDGAWRAVLDRFRFTMRESIERFGGREINTRGDDFLVTFDSPARGVKCALAMLDASRAIGLEIRAGLHTGEVERMDNDIGGVAVHLGARVAASAEAGQILVSRTVVDLVAGSGIEFEDRGEHALKGIPGTWRLFALSGADA